MNPLLLAGILGGAGLLQNLFGRRREGMQYLPIPRPPIFIPNPALYELQAINQLLAGLPGGVQLKAPPGFNPALPLWRQWHIPAGWESVMRGMGYGQWVTPPSNFFDALLESLLMGAMGYGIGRHLFGSTR